MKQTICALFLAAALISQIIAAPVFAWGAEAAGISPEDIQEANLLEWDIFGLDEDGIYRKYADEFNGNDIILIVRGENQENLPVLRRFRFHSLELLLDYSDEESLRNMCCDRRLLFPETVTSVTVRCAGETEIIHSDGMDHLIISLSLCAPNALLNNRPVQEWAKELRVNDPYQAAKLYDGNVKMNYLFDLAQNGLLETSREEPVFAGKYMIMIYDDVDVSSQECLINKEPFFSVPSSWLTDTFEDADTAIFVFPVESILGVYANGGEAVSTYTRVLVVNLDQFVMYETYTAVRNDPPETMEIVPENGIYPTEGVTGAYEPKTALNQILKAKHIENPGKADTAVQKKMAELLPWVQAPADETETTISVTQETTGTNAGILTEAATTQPATQPQEPAAVLEAGTSRETEATSALESETASETATAASRPTTSPEPETTTEASQPTTAAVTAAAAITDATGHYGWLTEEMLEQIFTALGDDLYRNTYTALKRTRDLAYGTRGDLALALQKTLLAFGQSLTADSSIGNATLTCLRTVQAAFGLETTNKVSSKTYALLMPGLLVSVSPDQARELFGSCLSVEDGSEWEYMVAGAFFAQGAFYSAQAAYESSRFGDYENRAIACVQDMPATGQTYRSSTISGTDTSLTVQVNSYDELAATCVKISTLDDELVSCLIVRGSGSVTAMLPSGTYMITDGTGYRWYGIHEMFGEDGIYEAMIFDGGSEAITLQPGYDYTIAFNVQEHNEAAQSIGSDPMDWEELTD